MVRRVLDRMRVAKEKRRFRLRKIVSPVLAALLGFIGAHYFPLRRLVYQKPESLNLTKTSHIPAPEPQFSTPFGHPYYPYSVIPGGAHSQAELQMAVDSDSVVAKHYSDFIIENTRIVTLDEDRRYHVSYRVGDKIYWTRRVLTLHKGEQLLFDGVHYARARCGNRLSEVASTPVLGQSEPSPKKFEAPVPVQMSLTMQVPHLEPGPDLPLEITSVEDSPERPSGHVEPYVAPKGNPGGYFNGSGGSVPLAYPEVPSSSAVPEPSSGELVSLMALLIIAVQACRRRR